MVGMIVSGLVMVCVPSATKTEIKTYEVLPDTIFNERICYIDENRVICEKVKFKRAISDDGTFFEIVTTSPSNDFWLLPFLTSTEHTLYLNSTLFEK